MCAQPGTALIAERSGVTLALDPAGAMIGEVGLPPDLAITVSEFRNHFWRALPHRWLVALTSSATGTEVEVTDRATGATVIDVGFRRRIEIAALAISPSARFTLYIQSNNLASEVTVLDAATGSSRLVRIPHNATLAAFAIGVAFSPDERCVAISMERADGSGPSAWLLDLATGELRLLDQDDVFVLDWVAMTAGRE